MIRIQVTGGLGNQLFMWAGAHVLEREFGTRVKLVSVTDSNSRRDRPVELQQISKFCSHKISICNSRLLGVILRVVDKFQLERFSLSNRILKFLGFYTFTNPVSTLVFAHGKPRFIRCYFQRTSIVESAWTSWSHELTHALDEVDLSNLRLEIPSNSVHIRRGDFLFSAGTYGVLSEEFFKENMELSLPNYLCTDEIHPQESLRKKLRGKAFLTPSDADTWQTLKIFCESSNFLGSNSTLSWWGSFLRIKANKNLTSLPSPWTLKDLGYDDALRIRGVNYRKSEFSNAT